MTKTTIFGIKNCDTMKKALRWLDNQNIAYDFHDYKKHGIDESALQKAISEHGWQTVINTRGTTWRQLPKEQQATINDNTAASIARENPSLIKRPLLLTDNRTKLGFKEETYAQIFKK